MQGTLFFFFLFFLKFCFVSPFEPYFRPHRQWWVREREETLSPVTHSSVCVCVCVRDVHSRNPRRVGGDPGKAFLITIVFAKVKKSNNNNNKKHNNPKKNKIHKKTKKGGKERKKKRQGNKESHFLASASNL